MEKHWYVFYTRSRWEKKVLHLLERAGYEVFLPMHKVMRQWSDRKKKVEAPLFNSYIFVKVSRNSIYEVLRVPGIVKSVIYNGEPAILNEKEYQQINSWLETGLPLEVQGLSDEVKLGDQVKVLEGNFKGVEGELYRINDTTCAVLVASIQQVLMITVRKELVTAL